MKAKLENIPHNGGVEITSETAQERALEHLWMTRARIVAFDLDTKTETLTLTLAPTREAPDAH